LGRLRQGKRKQQDPGKKPGHSEFSTLPALAVVPKLVAQPSARQAEAQVECILLTDSGWATAS
jgi:hypothetical protein